MSDQLLTDIEEAAQLLNTLTVDADVRVRNVAKREVDVRLAPFGVVINTLDGPEVIEPGAFRGAAPDSMLLMGLEHEVHLGIGQRGNLIPTRRAMGRSIAIEERADGGYATFKVAKTEPGDEFLALVEDGVIRAGSMEMGKDVKVRAGHREGRRTNFVTYADATAWSPTYHPAYAEAQVLAVRAEQEVPAVATENDTATTVAPEAQEAPKLEVIQTRSADEMALIQQMSDGFGKSQTAILDRLEKIEERGRMGFDVPATVDNKPIPSLGSWMQIAVKILTGERIPDVQYARVAELITTDNAGVVPDAYSDRLIGVIDPRAPFMATTTTIPAPESGMQLIVPKIVTRPTVGLQVAEKDDLASTTTSITTESFGVQTYGGVGDISIQLLKRSDPSFLELYLRLLAEALAIELEEACIDALLTAVAGGGPEPAGPLNPASLNLGAAFQTSFASIRTGPDTIWMSSEAVAEFIDAKATGTNAPLYANLTANFTAAGGVGGTISGLRAVHVPALDAKGAYAIVGPSTGFAHATEGSFTLQVDVPSKAGRDVALVSMLWAVPWYPEAFTLFNVAS